MKDIWGITKGDYWHPDPKTDYAYLTREQVKKLRPRLRRDFAEDSEGLFNSAWKEILSYASNAEVLDYQYMKDLYAGIISNKVNNPRSKFYMYG